MQLMGVKFGSKLVKAPKPKHGKISEIETTSNEIFNNLPTKFNVTRYHSLVLNDISDCLKITSFSLDDNQIMSFKHENLPIWGVQFHPEAILTEHGINILKNWVTINKLISL